MKVVVLYRPNSEHSRLVEDYFEDFKRLHPEVQISLVNVDSVDGSSQAQTYDILQFPAILAISNDGQLVNAWLGETMPQKDEILGYVYS